MRNKVFKQIRQSEALTESKKIEAISRLMYVANMPVIKKECKYFKRADTLFAMLEFNKTPFGFNYWMDLVVKIYNNPAYRIIYAIRQESLGDETNFITPLPTTPYIGKVNGFWENLDDSTLTPI